MKLDIRELQTRRRSVASALASAQARYAQALAGATLEDIGLAEASVASAQARVASAGQSLDSAKSTGDASVAAAETSLRGTLESLYLEAQSTMQALEKDVYDAAGSLKRDLVTSGDAQAAQSSSAFILALDSSDRMADDIQAARATTTLAALDPIAGRLLSEGRDIRTSAQLASKLLQNASPTAGLTVTGLETRRTDMDSAWSSINLAINAASSQRAAAASAAASAAAASAAAERALSEAEASLATAQAQLNLKKAPLREVDRAVYQAAVTTAQADLSTIDQQLADATITAPEDGIIGTVDIKVGELASGARRALSLISVLHEITADVSELDIGKIAIGSQATISFDAIGGQPYVAKVTKIAPRETSKDSDIYYVTTLVLDDATAPLRPGMTADISILVGKKDDVVLAPKRLIIKRNSQELIKVLKDGKPVEVPVRLGLEGEDDVEIVSGLAVGDQLISG
jgi:RND family efflux transporter MFP subunit